MKNPLRALFASALAVAAPIPLLAMACGGAALSKQNDPDAPAASVAVGPYGARCEPYLVTLDAALPHAQSCGADAGGNLSRDACSSFCGQRVLSCAVADAGDPPTISCQRDCTGRRPAGLRPLRQAPAARSIGQYLGEMAHLESASVCAFRVLARELSAHGAPRRLVAEARRAARDEVRHARIAAGLARRHRGAPRHAIVDRTPVRALEAVATENAVEGCVRETYGALVGAWQARAAEDPQVRAAMVRIADDEMRHAALSWKVARWAEARLDRAARARVYAARHEAARSLASSVAAGDPDPEHIATLGLPPADVAASLVATLERALWSAA